MDCSVYEKQRAKRLVLILLATIATFLIVYGFLSFSYHRTVAFLTPPGGHCFFPALQGYALPV